MMQIIITGLEQDRFSLWRFYLARARRIIPALLALCSTLLCLGWFWLPTLDYSQLAKHAFTAILFLSNVKFGKKPAILTAYPMKNGCCILGRYP